jgi:hypothetical protein
MKEKYVLGKGEIKTLELLENSHQIDEVVKNLLSSGIISSSSIGRDVIHTIKDKKFVESRGNELYLTEAGKLQRKVLILLGYIGT